MIHFPVENFEGNLLLQRKDGGQASRGHIDALALQSREKRRTTGEPVELRDQSLLLEQAQFLCDIERVIAGAGPADIYFQWPVRPDSIRQQY